jgi:hypothetical protein
MRQLMRINIDPFFNLSIISPFQGEHIQQIKEAIRMQISTGERAREENANYVASCTKNHKNFCSSKHTERQ